MLEYYDFSTSQKREKQKLHIAPGLFYIKIHKKKNTIVADTCTCFFVERNICKEKKSKVSYFLLLSTNFSMDKCREEKSVRIHIIR